MSEETNEFLDRSDLDFVRDALIDALDQRRDSLVSELFDLYNRVRERENAPTPDPFAGLGNINISTTDTIDGTAYNFAAGGDVAIGNTEGQDVISFS